MLKKISISIFGVIGTSLCTSCADGQKVYDRISTAIKSDRNVALSFHSIEMLTASFLNVAIGQLYSQFSVEKIRNSIRVENICQEDLALLKRVIENAKLHFKKNNLTR